MTLSKQYNALIERREITDDPAQRQIMQALEALRKQLQQLPQDDGLLSRLFKKPGAPVRGLYIWGSVGRGKSMLMDLFFANAPVTLKRHVHFHMFMQEVHSRIHDLRQNSAHTRSGADPVAVLAQQLATENALLCFDELQATDVADATLLYRLFAGLMDAGVVLVTTSNRSPETLYTGGIQAERFQKFIGLIRERMDVMSLDSESDYRLLQRRAITRVYHTPLGRSADQFIRQAIDDLADGQLPRREKLHIKGRTLTLTTYPPNIGRFSFSELCEQPLGPADYLAIAQRFATILLTGIPALGDEKRNEAKRFVILIDTLYEQGVRLICTAEVAPEHIYSSGDGTFEFQRTVSRLMEMQSARYLQGEKPVASP